jgi:hypothetical protein
MTITRERLETEIADVQNELDQLRRQWLELIGGKTTEERIARILASGPRRGTELVRLTGKSKEHVAMVLARMRLNGQVIRISRGIYGLDCQKTR